MNFEELDKLAGVGSFSTKTPQSAGIDIGDSTDIDSLASLSASIAGVPKEWIKAQWRHETGDFTNWGTKVANNFGGMKQFKPQPSWFTGDAVSPEGDNYQVFESPKEYAEYFGRYIKKYVPGAETAKTPEEYAAALKSMGYYGDSVENYAKNLKAYIDDSSPVFLSSGAGGGGGGDAYSDTDQLSLLDRIAFGKAEASPLKELDNIAFSPSTSPPSSTTPPIVDLSSSFEKGVYGDTVPGAGEVTSPSGGGIIDALSNLNRGVSALAGGLESITKQKGSTLAADIPTVVERLIEGKKDNPVDLSKVAEATKKGFVENDKTFATSFASEKFAKEHPIAFLGLGFVIDAAGDPVQWTKPQKAVQLVTKVAQKTGATDKIADFIRLIGETKGGQVTRELAGKIANYEIGGLPLWRWVSEEGKLNTELTNEARLRSALLGATEDNMKMTEQLKKMLIDNGVEPATAESLAAKAVQARPTVETQLKPDEIVKAYRKKELDQLIIDGKVDVQDAIDAIIFEKNNPAGKVLREETKAKIKELKQLRDADIATIRRDAAAGRMDIAQADAEIAKIKADARAEIKAAKEEDRTRAFVEYSRSGKGTRIADEYLTPEQLAEVKRIRKEKAEALQELKDSIDPYGLTIDELPDRVALNRGRKIIDDLTKPEMDAAYRADNRVVPDWETAIRVVTSENPVPSVTDRFTTKIGNKTVLVTRNPKRADFEKMQVSPSAPRIITVYDNKGNKYVWTGNEKSQGAIEEIISERHGVSIVKDTTGPVSFDIPTAQYKNLFPQDILDLIRYDPEELSRAVKNGEILPQQVVDAVNKAKDMPTISDKRIADTKETIESILRSQDTAIQELEYLKAQKKITQEDYKGRIDALKSMTKDAIEDAALEWKLHKYWTTGEKQVKVPSSYIDDTRREQIATVRKEAAETKKDFAETVDPYGISIEEKLPSQQIREYNKRINAETNKLVDEIASTRGVRREDIIAEIEAMGLKPEVVAKVKDTVEAVATLNDNITRSLWELGEITDKEMVKFFGGTHLRRSYSMFDDPEEWFKKLKEVGTPEEIAQATKERQIAMGNKMWGRDGLGTGLNQSAVIERVPLSEATRQKMGQIENSEYLVGKTGQTSIPLLTKAKFYDDVAQKFGVTEAAAAGNENLARIPVIVDSKTKKPLPIKEQPFGTLSGLYVPKEILSEVMLAAKNFSHDANGLQKAVSWWKIGKLLNPASIARNVQSGFVMMNVFGDVPMVHAPTQLKTAFNEMRTHGPVYLEARDAGVFRQNITNQELESVLGKSGVISKSVKKGMDIYGASDEFYRLAVYDYHRNTLGKTIQEAADMADRALFNYGKVPPIIDYMRKNGIVPFAAFPYFAAKETARALYKDPASVSKWLRPQWQDKGNDERNVLPDYMKNHVLMKLGAGERTVKGEKQNITSFLDMTYLLPFMNDVSFGPAGAVYDVLANGKDFLGRDLTPPRATWQENVKDRGAELYNIAAPTILSKSYLEKPYLALTGNMDAKGRMYSPKEAAAQAILGWKTVNVNMDEEYGKRMMGLNMDMQKARQDLRRLYMVAEPSKSDIAEREAHIQKIAKEMSDMAKAYSKASKAVTK